MNEGQVSLPDEGNTVRPIGLIQLSPDGFRDRFGLSMWDDPFSCKNWPSDSLIKASL